MADILDTKLRIYEAFNNGYITESEKSELLGMVTNAVNEGIENKISKRCVGYKFDMICRNFSNLQDKKLKIGYHGKFDFYRHGDVKDPSKDIIHCLIIYTPKNENDKNIIDTLGKIQRTILSSGAKNFSITKGSARLIHKKWHEQYFT